MGFPSLHPTCSLQHTLTVLRSVLLTLPQCDILVTLLLFGAQDCKGVVTDSLTIIPVLLNVRYSTLVCTRPSQSTNRVDWLKGVCQDEEVITNYFLKVCSSSFEPLRFRPFRPTSYSIRLPALREQTYLNLFKLCSSIPSERSIKIVTTVSDNHARFLPSESYHRRRIRIMPVT